MSPYKLQLFLTITSFWLAIVIYFVFWFLSNILWLFCSLLYVGNSFWVYSIVTDSVPSVFGFSTFSGWFSLFNCFIGFDDLKALFGCPTANDFMSPLRFPAVFESLRFLILFLINHNVLWFYLLGNGLFL